MSAPGDASLLRDWSIAGSEKAFTELARRYAGLLYHAAQRRTGSRDMAGEAVQNSLLILARKAHSLTDTPSLAGWLHRTVCYEAAKVLRRERRHEARMKKLPPPDEADPGERPWQEAAPLLDEALDDLSEKDRQVIFLKYFDDLSFEQMARQFGGEPAAWRQRGSRAMERLRLTLARRGVALSSSGLAIGLGGSFSQAAPASVLAAVSVSPAAGAASLSSWSLVSHALYLMKLSPTPVILTTLLVVAIPLCFQASALVSLRQRVEALQFAAASNAKDTRSRVPTVAVRATSSGSGLRSLADLLHAGQQGARVEQREAEERIKQMDEEELESMLLETVSIELPREKRQLVINQLLIRYAFTKEPKTPVDKVLHMVATLSDYLGKEGQESVWAWAGVRIKLWAAMEPEKALAWYQEEEKTGRLDAARLNLSFPGSIYSAIRAKDPEQAEDFYQSMSDDQRMSVTAFFMETGSAEEFVSRTASFKDPVKRQSTLRMLFQLGTKGKSAGEVATWIRNSKADGDDAVELLALAAEGRPYREKEGSTIRSPMHMTRDEIEGRILWLRDPSLGEMTPDAIGAFLAGVMKSSPDGTRAALDKEWGAHRDDQMLAAYIRRAGSSVEGVIDALERSIHLQDPGIREQALRELMRGTSADEAREAIHDGRLSAETLENLNLPDGLLE